MNAFLLSCVSTARVQAAPSHITFGDVLILILASARTGLNWQACSKRVQSLPGKQLMVPAGCQCWVSICLMAFSHTTDTSEIMSVYQKEANKLVFFGNVIPNSQE